MKGYSQAGQDLWVMSLFPKGYKGFCLDLGCNHPTHFSNSYLLELHGWNVIAVDIEDYSNQWKIRRAKFFQLDAKDAKKIFDTPILIDYLSVDIDSLGDNYEAILNLIEAGFYFKCLTIEHNLYLGKPFDNNERVPQRRILNEYGYKLIRPDVQADGNIFEDWWINPKYITL